MSAKRKIAVWRLWVVFGAISLVSVIIGWRLIALAWFQHAWYAQTADAQAGGASNVLLRGNIYFSDGHGGMLLAATNKKFPALIITPSRIDQVSIDATIAEVVTITGLASDTVRTALTAKSSGARTLMRKLSDDQVLRIKGLGRAGVSVGYETDRSYPEGVLGADMIGFLGYSEAGRVGQYGVEGSYESELSGRDDHAWAMPWNPFAQVARIFGQSDDSPAADRPNDIELTIDANIQEYAQKVLSTVLERYKAASGTLIVQEPKTGRLLAVADSPTFDPNTYNSSPVGTFMDGALVPFEPGSSFKAFTMAIGLDRGLITPTTTYDDVDDIVVDGYTIKNFNEGHFGRVTMTQVLEKSINAGTMHVQTLVGNEKFLDGVVNLGFGQKTGVDLPGEAAGDISNLYTGRRINFLTASFGQGITVTPLQLITAYSAIANGGKLMRPYAVSAVIDGHGSRTETAPEVLATPFLAKTAEQLRIMLTSVVDKGFDKARIPRYDVAGKTGTAQIASPEGGYLEGQYNHSFVGFAPASDPKFVILIRMERPQGVTFAADSLSPAFKDMAQFLITYLNIPPTR